jgi:cyclophilin family peptidyl-prolyl cis-trans isomerase
VAVRWAVGALGDEATTRAVAARLAALLGVTEEASARETSLRVAKLEGLVNGDPSALVRFEAIRSIAQNPSLGARSCAWLLAAFDDADLNVAKYAMANAHHACRSSAAVRARLEQLATTGSIGPASGSWHRGAYALQGLSLVAPDAARPRVLTALGSPNAWVRRTAVAAAEALLRDAASRQSRDEQVEREIARLAGDADHNVAAAAIHALAVHRRADARSPALRALDRDDGELLLGATAALAPPNPAEGEASVRVPDEEIATACAKALERVTAARRETSRDPRVALVECVAQRGSADHARHLEPLLADFDPAVATKAAAAIASLRPGTAPPVVAPKPLPRAPLPTDSDLARLSTVRVTLHLRGRGPVTIRLRPDEAPLNAWRFLRLAESGYYTGLTFHRIATGFVVQGGSPGANEYSGDGPFSRDEVGLLSNLRGTVGLSTRGRDTGDAQFYVNLVDNLRLDHTYTVFGQVEAGMDVVDALVEGDVIERVEVRN